MKNLASRGRRLLALVVMTLMAAGCLGGQEIAYTRPDALPMDKAVVYFYRPFNVINGAVHFDVLVNGAEIGILSNKGYLPLETEPGNTDIELKSMVFPYGVYGSLSLNLKPGQVHFVKYGPDSAMGKFKFRMMDPSTGEDEIKACTWFKRDEG
jgi:Protein of unknown function (DUF2846)